MFRRVPPGAADIGEKAFQVYLRPGDVYTGLDRIACCGAVVGDSSSEFWFIFIDRIIAIRGYKCDAIARNEDRERLSAYWSGFQVLIHSWLSNRT